ncbi:MAG: choice-of-anchor C family protein [Planctomycetes bacterium]|nr:choice-of-anchor C family protein [Planctomycetota bacterium]
MKYLVIIVCLIVTFTVTAEANLVLNGSFESGPELIDSLGYWQNVYPPSTAIDNWTVINNSVNYKGPYWEASDGIYSLDLNGEEGPGGVEQAFATVIGAEYSVTFDMAGNPSTHVDNYTSIKWMTVAAAGDSADFWFDITGKTNAAMGYEGHTWSFTATGTLTTLQFYSTDPTDRWGPVLDNVVVVAIPEPVTTALLGASVLALLLKKRR